MADRWRLSVFGDEIAPKLEDQIATLQQHGVGALELRSAWGVNAVELRPERLDHAARLLGTAGIAVSAIGSPVGKAPIEGDFETERSRFRAAVDAAKRLGAKRIRVFSFFIPDGRYADFRDEVLRRMSSFVREAVAENLILVHENESYIYGDDARRCHDLVESVGSPGLEIAFDPANFVQVGVPPFDDAWPLLREHVGHFHVKDAVSVDRSGLAPYPSHVPEERLMASVRPAGEGEGQLPELLRELDSEDYRGYLVIEPHLQHRRPDLDGAGRFAIALTALRTLLNEMSVTTE
ncbi:MAG TPA: sugar phosphate isomerase/epimerase family protein [Candidatus Eisenbacteria bacterium]|nr:sugar phosphate isomerase/epimerase family protein [Candidatus Eisenbacteria bacterium]